MIRIYKITDRTNNKIYIGQTKRDIYRRFGEHLSRVNSKRKNDKACALYIAMNNHGKENFYVELIEELDTNDINISDNRERYWIAQFNSTDPNVGYNLDLGGHIISDKCREAKRLLQIGKPLPEHLAKANRERGMLKAKPILLLNSNNEIMNEFKSIIEASRITGKDRRGIQRFLSGEYRPKNPKFIWKYKE